MKAFWQSVRVIARSSAGAALKQIQRHFGIGGVMEAEKARNAAREKQIMVEKQGDTVRAMKAAKLPQEDIDKAVNDLKHLKLELQELQAKLSDEGEAGALSKEAFRQAVNNTLERRLFYIPSFKIYRGVAGLYDYGPPGCAVKANVIAYWRQVRREPDCQHLTNIVMVILTNSLSRNSININFESHRLKE